MSSAPRRWQRPAATAAILLMQARVPNDPMAIHERDCIARKLGPGCELTTVCAFDRYDAEALLADCDGVIYGGSGDFSVHHAANRSWVTPLSAMLARIVEGQRPALLICFGHQLLGALLGQPVHTSPDQTEIGTITLHAEEPPADADPLFSWLGAHYRVHTGHTDAVEGVPAGVQLLARSETLDTQAFRVVERQIWSTQFHPDLTGAEARARFLAYADSLSGPDKTLANAKAGRFMVGADESCGLLSRFADVVLDTCAAVR